jgi:hypothetical protein
MGFSFNGIERIIELTPGTTSVSIRSLYSQWKEWVRIEGHQFKEAFSVVGGDPIDITNGIYISSYFFLINSWKIKPQAADHSLRVYDGILATDTGEDPFIPSDGYYNVQIKYSQPIMSETIATGGGGSFTTEDREQLNNVSIIINNIKHIAFIPRRF